MKLSHVFRNKKIIAVGFFVFFFVLSPATRAAAADLKFSKLYVFGDSLSDIGNIFDTTVAANTIIPGVATVTPPSPPYYNGRFSNGPNWVDDLAKKFGLTLIPSTQLAAGGPVTSELRVNYDYGGTTGSQSVDFAYGGAGSGFNNIGGSQLPGLLNEIQSFTDDLKISSQPADSNALYIIWSGGFNDYLSGITDPNKSTANIVQALTLLYEAGGRNFLVPNISDLGKNSYITNILSASSTELTQFSLQYDTELKAKLNNLNKTLEGSNSLYLDQNFLSESIAANPTAFGFINVTDPCLVAKGNSFSVCPQPDAYLSWDGLHPTASANRQLAEFALAELESAQIPQEVPEPSSVSLIAVGFAWLLWLAAQAKSKSPS